jgi:hypothetical protein
LTECATPRNELTSIFSVGDGTENFVDKAISSFPKFSDLFERKIIWIGEMAMLAPLLLQVKRFRENFRLNFEEPDPG